MSDTSTLHDLHEASGKVREMYGFGDRLLMVASDRISAFDVVLPTPIPDKGRVLTGLSHFWFGRTEGIIPNHLITTDLSAYPPEAQGAPDLAGRSMLVKRLTMMPIECVVRGYLVGSGWKDYRATGTVCGHSLPPGMVEAQKLPKPIFTPSTKATDGHDQNIDRDAGVLLVGEERFDRLAEVSIQLYETAAEYALERGIIIADTKFEFGEDETGALVLGDEALTPDSSRFWPADEYATGGSPPSYDKQYVRDWLETLDWDKTPPGPEIPEDVVAGTRARYVEAYERLTGGSFDAYLASAGGSRVRVTVTVRPREGILDPQGEALRRSLAGLGYDVTDVRAGKVFDLELEAADEADALRIADEISERVLSNPLIEDYRVGA